VSIYRYARSRKKFAHVTAFFGFLEIVGSRWWSERGSIIQTGLYLGIEELFASFINDMIGFLSAAFLVRSVFVVFHEYRMSMFLGDRREERERKSHILRQAVSLKNYRWHMGRSIAWCEISFREWTSACEICWCWDFFGQCRWEDA
jgi:hypothetical protein